MDEKEKVISLLMNWLERVTTEPSTLQAVNRPTQAEYAALPELARILLDVI